MHSRRDIHPFDTGGRGTPLISAVSLSLLLFSASLAAASLSPAVAQSAAPSQQATVVSPDAIKQREEELEATREQQRKAKLRIAFGSATWPHQMVRVMLLEQIYRAATILAGHPYHRA